MSGVNSGKVNKIFDEVSKVLVGQRYMIERLILGLLSDGHILIEGVPGLAKTLAVNTLSSVMDFKYGRVQFTPDILPGDLIGTVIYSQKNETFIAKKGPIFTNILLTDEINRAPAKVQSALLECMAERQVTIGDETYKLDEPFLVLATQNPIEQEGTYPLPEAQMDRFSMKLKIMYPTKEEEKIILEKMTLLEIPKANKVLSKEEFFAMKKDVYSVYVDEKIKKYVLEIIFASRFPLKYGLESVANYIEYGASPRGSINLIKVSKAYAFINGRDFVVPEDIKSIIYDVLRHRILLSFEAEAEGISSDDIIKKILDQIEVP